MAYCPRCGEPMTGGICNNCGFEDDRVKNKYKTKGGDCGFPLTKMRKKYTVDNRKSNRTKNGSGLCK